MCAGCWNPDPTPSPSRVRFLGGRGGGEAECWFKGNVQLGWCPPEPWAWVPTAAEGRLSGGYSLLQVHLYHTNGKKKLKGNLALMVGGTRKPASAGADMSTNVTVVEMTIVLSGPGRGWNGKTQQARSSSSSLSHCYYQLEAGRYAQCS